MKNKSGLGTMLNSILHLICSAVGTLLLSFCLLSNILHFTLNIPDGYLSLPILALPANVICMTFGMDYWIGNDPFRRWATCILNVVLTAFLLAIAMEYSLSNNYSTFLGMIAAILLPNLVILYNFRTVLKKRTFVQTATTVSPLLPHYPLRLWFRAAIRVLCLFSICCVLLGSWYYTILECSYFLTIPSIYFSNQMRNQIILSILSAILLAKFMKAEFVESNPSPDSP